LETIISEWIGLCVRWLHVIAGIAWVGTSFYFVHLDSSIRRTENLPDEVGGETWQVHSGGFYHMVKYLVAPARLPEELTWFRWEAYATWLSGFALLALVYYLGAELYLIDNHVLKLDPWQAIAISMAGLLLGWIGYDLLCKSPLAANDAMLTVVGFLLLAALAYGWTFVFSARGAYMQMGAMIGTIMVANVWRVVIPNQKIVVADLIAGRRPDPRLGEEAKLRSMHNNYLTLPILFVMISNHYPLAYASRWGWLIFTLILLVGASIRHFFNVRHTGGAAPWWSWGVAAAGIALVMWLSSYPPEPPAAGAQAATAAPVKASPEAVREIVLTRCSMCHSAEPVWAGIHVAPKGVRLDTPELIRLNAHRISVNVVLTHAMPPGNITGIEPGERATLAAWIAAGAPMGARPQ